MISEPWEVVVVPFPFVDRGGTKRRPALVLSRRSFNAGGHSLLAMITTKGEPPWPGDVAIRDLRAAGLPRSCIVRLKLFTLDNRLVLERRGRLARADREGTLAALLGALGSVEPSVRGRTGH